MLLRLFPVVLLSLCASVAAAQEVEVIGTHGKWIAQTYKENGKPVCFMSVKPDKSEGNYKARGDVLFMVTHRPAEKAYEVVSIVAGYQYLPDSDAVLTIGGQKFNLFTTGERAWARDSKTDKAMTQLMMKGRTMTVRGTSSRNNVTTDSFSLAGFTAAYKAISERCDKP
jgi:invasion protein IalB